MSLPEYFPLDFSLETASATPRSATYTFSSPKCSVSYPADAQLLAALHILHFRRTGIENAATGHWDGTTLRRVGLKIDATEKLSTIFQDAAQVASENSLDDLRVLVSKVESAELVDGIRIDWTVNTSVDAFLSFHVRYDCHFYSESFVIELSEDILDILTSNLHLAVNEVHFTHVSQRLLRSNIPIHPRSVTPSPHTTLADAFGEMVSLYPENVALIDGPQAYTYAQFDILINVLAAKISKALDGKEMSGFIACCIPPSALAVLTIFSIVKQGAAYVPLDVRLPTSRLEDLVDESTACMLITTSDSPVVSLEGKNVVHLDITGFLTDWESVVAAYAAHPTPYHRMRQNNVAYVLYTSGTTGKPKGVCISHTAVLALAAKGGHMGISPGMRVAQINNLAWDGSVLDLWATLLSGATLVCLDRYEILEPKSLARLLRHFLVQCCLITPSIFRQLLAITPEVFRDFLIVCTGGEAVSFEQYVHLRNINPNLTFVNVYGPTETCCYVVTNTVYPHDAMPLRGPVPLGLPLDHAQCLVVDTRNRLVHPGMLGELLIGGASVGEGYLNRPKETSSAFVDLAFDEIAQSTKRFYRTGDLVKWMPDGKLMFYGRIGAGQVKIRGQRLELAEVEAALVQTGLVAQAGVVYVKIDDREPYLTAYAVHRAGATGLVQPREVLRLFKTQVPGYMVPRQLAFVENLPISNTGKLDRRRLYDMAIEADGQNVVLETADDYVAPRSGPEERVCQIFQEVLPTSTAVGATSNFFDVGGHSLLAMRLKWRLEEEFNTHITIQDIFLKQTPRTLVTLLVEPKTASANSALRPTQANELQPLSVGQKRMYHLTQKVLNPKDGVYNTSAWLRLSGTLDEDVLERSIQEIVRRHEGLRSVFVEVSDVPMAKITEWVPTLQKVDVDSSWDQDRLETQLRVDCKVAFSLDKEVAFRPILYRLGGQRYILMISMHHIITDGFAHDLLFAELVAIYPAFLHGESHPLPPLELQYSSYAQWQNTSAYEDMVHPQLQYWNRALSGQKPVSFPPDSDILFKPGMVGAVHSVPYPAKLIKQFEALCRRERVTMYMFFMAVFRVLHYQLTGETDGSIGGSIANRKLPGTLKMCGYFNNILIYRTGIIEGQSFVDVLRHVRDVTMEAYANQDAPLARVLAQIKSEGPHICTMLAYHNFEMTSFEVGTSDLKADNFDLDMRLNQYQVEMKFVRRGAEGLCGNLHYPVDLYKKTTIAWLGEKLNNLLTAVVETPELKVHGAKNGWQPPQ